MSNKITKRQREVLMAIYSFTTKQGISPTIRELCQLLDVKSDQSIIGMLERLEKGGWIARDRHQARSVIITTDAKNVLGIVSSVDTLTPFVLDDQSKRVYDQLIKIDPRLGSRYMGALSVLRTDMNDDKLAQSAHSMREVIRGLSSEGKKTIPPELKKIIEKNRNTGSVETGLSYFFDPNGVEGIDINPYRVLYKDYQCKLDNISHHNISLDEIEYSTFLKDLNYFLLRYIFPKQLDVYQIIDKMVAAGSMGVDPVDLRMLISRNVETFKYFFRQATADWVTFLKKNNFLNPSREVGEYLLRIAPEVPLSVLDIFLGTDLQDQDSYTIGIYIEGLSKLPPVHASKAVDKVLKIGSLQESGHSVLYYKLQGLFEALITGGQMKEANLLASQLFAVYGNKHRDEPHPWITSASFLPDYEYSRSLKLVTSLHADNIGGLLIVFANKLEQLVKEVHVGTTEESEDFSYIWRPTIENSGQEGTFHGVENALVSVVRDLLEKRISNFIDKGEEDKARRELNRVLGKKVKYLIFQRIRMYIFATFPRLFWNESKDILSRPSLKANTWNGYCQILKNAFPIMDSQERSDYLEVLEIDDESDKYDDSMKSRIVAIIGNFFTSEEKKRYETLLKKSKLVHKPDLLQYMESSSGWIGERSPVEEGDLSQMSTVQILELLKRWMPKKEDDFFGPSPDGLGHVFREVVSKDGDRFFREAGLFADGDLEPRYLYDLFTGLSVFMKNGTLVDLAPILDLIEYVIGRSQKDEVENLNKEEISKRWPPVIKEAVRLVVYALDKDFVRFQDKGKVWGIIAHGAEHVDPTISYEAKYCNGNMDPYTLSVNSVRGKSFHAIFAYIFWFNRIKKSEEKEWEPHIPKEAKKVLLTHLDIVHDPSISVRSVYGRFFPWINKYDPVWADELISLIFPEDNDLFYAAWETYLSNPVFDAAYLCLRPQYERALSDVKSGDKVPKRRYWVNTTERLAAHVVVAYVFDLDSKEDPFYKLFFNKMNGKGKGLAVSFAGRMFINKDLLRGDPQPNLTRLREFWEWRLEKSDSPKELAEFGWWAKRGRFDDEWLLERLLDTVRKTKGGISAEFVVMKTVEDLAGLYPLLCVQILSEIYSSVNTNERFAFMRMEELRSSLYSIYKSSDSEARNIAENLVDRLLKIGFSDLETLKIGDDPEVNIDE